MRMKAIPIEYIQEFIDAWDDCKDDPEVRGGEVFKNKLYCSARRNALINLIKYWEEDKDSWREE